MNNVSIIILTYNNLDYNIQCIQSIREYTQKETYEIIIVDNGSTDGTREWLNQQKDLITIFPDENTGFPKGCNLGIKTSKKDNDILLLNNDIVVTPHWLDNLMTCLYSNDSIGAVGPVTNYAWNNQSITVPYNSIQDMLEFSQTINNSDKTKWELKAKLVGFCLLIKRKVLNIIGLLDERFSPGNFEDDDLCVRITEKGYKLFQCNDCFIHHYGNATFKKEPNKFNNTIAINSQKFRFKWGFEASLTENFDSEIISFIQETKDKQLNILEINCNRGTTLLRIKYLYPKTELYGIENNENIAKITSKLVNLSTKKIEQFPLEFNENFFDYILLGNYLEYCENPSTLLSELKKYLKPQGYLLLKIQNINHYSLIKNLLNGNFSNTENNFVNITNKNLFTYNDLLALGTNCGYSLSNSIYYYNLRNDEDNKIFKKLCSISNENMKWQLASYQYIFKFSKKS